MAENQNHKGRAGARHLAPISSKPYARMADTASGIIDREIFSCERV